MIFVMQNGWPKSTFEAKGRMSIMGEAKASRALRRATQNDMARYGRAIEPRSREGNAKLFKKYFSSLRVIFASFAPRCPVGRGSLFFASYQIRIESRRKLS
jgi:hypothetical protein